MIPCIVIPAAQSSVFRQAKENTARSGLSAIAMARQTALLLLTVHGYEIPAYAVGNDFYRQALTLDLRGKREYTDTILTAMGGIEKAHFSRLKNLLRLSDEALELADRHSIEEYRLRSVVSVSSEYHAEIVRQVIDFNLNAKQIAELCQGESPQMDTDHPKDKLPSFAIKLAKVARSVNTFSARDLANALMLQEPDPALARVRLQAMRKLVSEAEQYLVEK
jgi:hypothetical protein